MRLLLHLLTLVRSLAADRARLATENLLLRQQLLVFKRSTKRVRFDDGDRAFWVAVRRWLEDWKEHLVIVKPETVLPRCGERKSSAEMRAALDGLGKCDHRGIETTLEAASRDPDVVSGLTAEVLNRERQRSTRSVRTRDGSLPALPSDRPRRSGPRLTRGGSAQEWERRRKGASGPGRKRVVPVGAPGRFRKAGAPWTQHGRDVPEASGEGTRIDHRPVGDALNVAALALVEGEGRFGIVLSRPSVHGLRVATESSTGLIREPRLTVGAPRASIGSPEDSSCPIELPICCCLPRESCC